MAKTNLWETLKMKYFTKFMSELYSDVSWMAKIWVHLQRHTVTTQKVTVMTWKVTPQHPQLFSQYPCITLGSVNLCPMPVAFWKKTATLYAEYCLAFYICYYRYSGFKTLFSAAAVKFTQGYPISKIKLSDPFIILEELH
jgi:hypothetical protein